MILPNGKSETLLDVPHYDSHWQTVYRLVEPRALPVGSHLRCVAHYDNSANNLNNPDPTKRVQWGPQTSDEMMVGYFDIALPKGQKPAAPKPKPPKVPTARPAAR